MTKLLRIPEHSRRSPIDPLKPIRAAKTAQLREEVALMDMEREICRLVDTAIKQDIRLVREAY